MWPKLTCFLLVFVTLGIPANLSAKTSRKGSGCQVTNPLPTRQKWARFAVVQGRITVLVAVGQSGSLSCEDAEEGRWESFGVHATPEATSVHYTFRTPEETTTYQFDGADQLTIEHERIVEHETAGASSRPRRLVVTQRAGRGIEVAVGEPESGPVHHAATWWHLLLTEPELAKREIVPLLERLRTDWQLEIQGERIESLLVTHPPSKSAPPLEKWVSQLADDRFEVRRQANRELRAMGPMLLPLLEQLDPRQLSAEQTVRLRSLQEELSPLREDTPHRVAGWLSYDARLGEAWIGSPHGARQLFAQRQLDQLRGHRSLDATSTESRRVARQLDSSQSIK